MKLRLKLARAARTFALLPLCLVFLAGCAVSDLTEAERKLLITELDLPPHEIQTPQTPSGAFSKTRNPLKRSTSLKYKVEAAKAGVTVLSWISVEQNTADALKSQQIVESGLKIASLAREKALRPIPLTRDFGKNVSLNVVMKNDRPIGNTFSTVLDNKAVVMLVIGRYVDNESDFAAFIEPKLATIREFKEP